MGVPQVVSAVLLMNTGEVLSVRTTMPLLTHNVLMHPLSARTKYSVLALGVTGIVVPVPIARPEPQAPWYHTQRALLAANPPFKRKVTDEPLQILSALAVIELAACDNRSTLTSRLTQGVVLHVPIARTKYVVVPIGVTAILLPIPTGVPLPQASAYQIQLALLPKPPPFTRRVT
jgi:hypothetical protein